MRIIFFGTSDFAVPSLEALTRSRHKVLLCLTQPDKKKGRFLKTSFSPVKEAALRLGLEVLQPDILDNKIEDRLRLLAPDIFVVIAYGNIFKPDLLGVPGKYCVNLHASLLPRYRGAAPINWAVLNGEACTGVTIIRMNEKMDAGDIIASQGVDIAPSDNSMTLGSKLSGIGAELIVRTLDMIEEGKESFEPQRTVDASFARKLKKEDGLIDWNKGAEAVHNKVRAFIPWPGAYSMLNGNKINIWKAKVTEGAGAAGEIIGLGKDKLIVATPNGSVSVLEIQLEGKKILGVEEFLRGFRDIKAGGRFA